MKKFLFTTILSTLALFAVAQDDDAKLTLGIMGGANGAFLQTKLPPGASVSNNVISVASFGINADFRFSNYLSVRPGIFYSGKGGDIEYETSFDSPVGPLEGPVEQKITLNYLEVPVTLIGHIPLSDSFNILLGAGPYVAMGLNGKVTKSYSTASQDDKVKFGSNGDLKSVDFGGTALLGFETESGIIVGINYDMGLTNIMNKNNSDTLQSLKTGAVYLSVGFKFQ